MRLPATWAANDPQNKGTGGRYPGGRHLTYPWGVRSY